MVYDPSLLTPPFLKDRDATLIRQEKKAAEMAREKEIEDAKNEKARLESKRSVLNLRSVVGNRDFRVKAELRTLPVFCSVTLSFPRGRFLLEVEFVPGWNWIGRVFRISYLRLAYNIWG